MQGYTLKFLSFAAVLAMAVSMMPANAGGVALTPTPSNGEINTATADGFATTTIAFTSSAIYASGATVQLVLSPAPSSTSIMACSPDATNIGGATFTAGSLTPTGMTWTLTGAAVNTSVTLCARVPVADGGTLTARNFSEAIITTGAAVDYGAAMFYINGGNDVDVSATVPPTLFFMISDPTTLTTEKHDCQLGTLSTASVNTCSYRLRIATNAANGFTTTIASDHKLQSGANTITDTGAHSTIVANTEGYGVTVTGAADGGRDTGTGLFVHPIVVDGAFTPSTNPVPAGAATILSYGGGFISGNTSTTQSTLVVHSAAINGATPAGSYTQKVTYLTTGSF